MKKTALIIGGIGAVLILFVVWLYLLIYGTPTNVAEYFTNFELFNNKVDPIVSNQTPTDSAPVTVDVKKDALRQLTTRPVVGFGEFTDVTSTTTFIRYAEAGTGHIYQINLVSGEEVRLSNVTVPNAESAAFSPNGKYVAVRSGFGTAFDMVLITLNPTTEAQAETLTPRMNEFTWSFQNELWYTQITSEGTEGQILNPTTKLSRKFFSVPFQTATMIWSHSSGTPNYVYPRVASQLLGYLYQIKNGSPVREPIDGLGLTAKANNQYIVETEVGMDTNVKSYIYERATGNVEESPIITDPYKCVFSPIDPTMMYCGYQIDTLYSYTFPSDWYKGTRSFSDRIWLIDLKKQSAIQLISPIKVTGRDIDVTNMAISSDAKMLYFSNKKDNTLWLYEISLPDATNISDENIIDL